MASTLPELNIPDILAQFPWSRNLSEYYHEAKAESCAWIESFHPLSGDALKFFNRTNGSLVPALAYPSRDKNLIRLAADLMNFTLIVDDYTDRTDINNTGKICDIIMKAFRTPIGEPLLGERHVLGVMARDLIIRFSNYVSPNAHCLQHLIRDYGVFMHGVTEEVHDRSNCRYRNFQDFLVIRRQTSGALFVFSICEFGLDLPEEVYNHPSLDTIREIASNVGAVTNDIYSYPLEKSRGQEIHNSVELVMREQHLDTQGAINWLAHYLVESLSRFLETIANVPSWGEDVDRRVQLYIDGIGQVIRGHDDWSFESGRYFGSKGLDVQKKRVMKLHAPMVKASA